MKVSPVKGGVAQTVTKGIDDFTGMVEVTCIPLTEDLVLIACFIVAIANVNAFRIGQIVVLRRLALLVVILVISEIVRSRGVERMPCEGVDRSA